jgi:hypothetical protein
MQNAQNAFIIYIALVTAVEMWYNETTLQTQAYF